MLDGAVKRADGDDAVLGVRGDELGHAAGKHSLRQPAVDRHRGDRGAPLGRFFERGRNPSAGVRFDGLLVERAPKDDRSGSALWRCMRGAMR